jgi:transposase-like protein
MLKAIHAQESREAADRKARAIGDDLRAARMNTAADLVEASVYETLTYYAFPDIHWQKIRTNNPLERIMKEIRRRTVCGPSSTASMSRPSLNCHRKNRAKQIDTDPARCGGALHRVTDRHLGRRLPWWQNFDARAAAQFGAAPRFFEVPR